MTLGWVRHLTKEGNMQGGLRLERYLLGEIVESNYENYYKYTIEEYYKKNNSLFRVYTFASTIEEFI